MSEIKALEELRHHAHVLKGGSTDYNELFEIADEIEAEIAERFVELPVDADGVPIHVGDEIECRTNGYDGTFTVFAIGNNVAVGNHDIEWIRRNPSKWFHVASFCTHVKPCTLEDVLREFTEKYQYCISDNGRSITLAKYAAEIRELLGVSE